MEQCSINIGDIEIVNQVATTSDSSSDEGGSKNMKKAIRMIQERNEAPIDDHFYVYQQFVIVEELKDMIKKTCS